MINVSRLIKTMISAYKIVKRSESLSKIYNSPLKMTNLMIFCVYLVARNTKIEG